ncbi:MAG: NAD(P)-dependent oxidoreductase [Rhodospirillaceae bacterium]|jgi:3-hydroxyisobutyrate dehydrogenase-like beta-hydroxyacid dehydrogenase|nr:NAD(P)-dependent oxidoreductase [Rhodospirillaceae bacterium]MBT5242662.1 NAD(P)-dependent oxidoreductase [Rhodospirillaceae bacterium]MBT5562825.1 NAD(P)-dependent oxidoreductase [Rhodospirillaceae bacterium]MBT6241254.1 NAD(P)-dependent oxidoreductase [Rhodospirillaceae bacterium]MBT7137107.1 NAD(P)-dependent oxidoreductase [Rhodospirillaceae bacterium]
MSKDKSQAIAFIGVGFMGHGIVKNILRGGYGLSILDHPGNRPVDDLVSAGAQLGERAGELAAAADIVFICVTGTPEVESVMLGEDGVLAGLREGSIVVDCSTALPDSTIKLAAAVAEKGGSLIDAPMTRTPKEAEEGRLNVMLGGETSAIEAVIDIINCYAENIYRTGPVGSGHKMKLLHNYLALGNAVLAAEATACAEKCGVDMDVYSEVIMSGGGDSLVFRRLLPYIQNGDDGSFKFSVANAEKDLRYYAAMAEELGAARAGSEAVHELLEQARTAGLEGQSMPNLIDYFRGLGQS